MSDTIAMALITAVTTIALATISAWRGVDSAPRPKHSKPGELATVSGAHHDT